MEQTSLEQSSLGVAALQGVKGVEAINFPIPEVVLRLRAADIVKVDQGSPDIRIRMENPMRQGDDKPEVGVVRQAPDRAAFYAAQKTLGHDGYYSAPLPDGLEKVEDAQDIGLFSRKPVFIQMVVLVSPTIATIANYRNSG